MTTRIADELKDLKAFAEAHHGDQPRHVLLHGLTVDIPARIDRIIEELECDPYESEDYQAFVAEQANTKGTDQMTETKERPFGSVNLGAELAVSMGMDPRPFLTEADIAEQLKLSRKTREEWDAAWDAALKARGNKYSDVPF